MRTKTFKREGEKITVRTGFDEDGEAAIIIVRNYTGGKRLKSTLTLHRASDSDTVFDFLTEDNVWEWHRALGVGG